MARQRIKRSRPRRPKRHVTYPRSQSTYQRPSNGWLRNIGSAAQFAWNNRKTIGNIASAGYKTAKGFFKNSKKTKNGKGTYTRQALQGTSQHNDASSRYFKCVLRKGRRGALNSIMHKKYHFKFVEDWDATITTSDGQQSVSTLRSIGSNAQIKGTVLTTTRSSIDGTSRSYYELNPFRTNTGSAIFPIGVPGTPINAEKIYYKRVTGSLKLVNLANISMHCTIYWLYCKKDTDKIPDNLWVDAITQEGMGGTVVVPSGTPTTGVSTPGVPVIYNLGQNPFMYKTFKDHWRVLEKKVYYLQGGDQIDTNFNFVYNKLLDKRVLTEVPATTLYCANYSIVPFMICHGGLVGIGTTGIPTGSASEVTTGSGKVGVMITQTHEFGPVPAETRYPTIQYYGGIVESGIAPAGDQMIIDTDVKSAVVIV